MQLLEKTFKLKEHKTTVLTEVVGGITTFFAMAYIIFVNPNFLSQTGMDHTAVMLATCISRRHRQPADRLPGQRALRAGARHGSERLLHLHHLLWHGLHLAAGSGYRAHQRPDLFLAVTVSPLRSKIIASIPASLKSGHQRGHRPVHLPASAC